MMMPVAIYLAGIFVDHNLVTINQPLWWFAHRDEWKWHFLSGLTIRLATCHELCRHFGSILPSTSINSSACRIVLGAILWKWHFNVVGFVFAFCSHPRGFRFVTFSCTHFSFLKVSGLRTKVRLVHYERPNWSGATIYLGG